MAEDTQSTGGSPPPQPSASKLKSPPEQMKQFSLPTASQPRPRHQDKGLFIPRSRANVKNCNDMTDDDRKYTERFIENFEKKDAIIKQSLLRVSKPKFTTTADIECYIKSFQYTFFAKRKFKSNTIVVDSFSFHSESDDIQKYWKDSKMKCCHILVIVGKKKITHLFGISINKNTKKIHVYDSKFRKTRKANVTNHEIKLCDKDWKEQILQLKNVNSLEVIKNVCEEVLHIEQQSNTQWANGKEYTIAKKKKDGEEENIHFKLPYEWKVVFINNFLQQQNNVDCGIFVCYFFECLSRDINLVGKYKGEDNSYNISMDLAKYRDWVAYSILLWHQNRPTHKRKLETEAISLIDE